MVGASLPSILLMMDNITASTQGGSTKRGRARGQPAVVGRLLEGIAQSDEARLAPGAPEELDADRESVCGEAAGDSDRRQAGARRQGGGKRRGRLHARGLDSVHRIEEGIEAVLRHGRKDAET